MKEISYYQNVGVPYPFEEKYVTFQVNNILEGTIEHKSLTKEELLAIGFSAPTKAEEATRQKVAGTEFLVIYRMNTDAYIADTSEYTRASNARSNEFYNDLAEKNGFDPSSKIAELVYSEAYERGHSAGYGEVAACYDSIANFAKEIIQASKEENL